MSKMSENLSQRPCDGEVGEMLAASSRQVKFNANSMRCDGHSRSDIRGDLTGACEHLRNRHQCVISKLRTFDKRDRDTGEEAGIPNSNRNNSLRL